MKKKLIIVLLILILILIIACLLAPKIKNTNPKDTTSDFMLNDDQKEIKINSNGENSGVYVGITTNDNSNYIYLSAKIDKSAPIEDQIKELISKISLGIGYKIDINSITVDNNSVKIDFAKTAAPFELVESVIVDNNQQHYFIASENAVAKTIFDSINKTLKEEINKDIEVYFSADSENIEIQNNDIQVIIDSSVPYTE